MSLEDGVDEDGYFYETARMKADSFERWHNRDPIADAVDLQIYRERKEQEAAEAKANQPIDPRLQIFLDRFAEIARTQSGN